MTGPEYHQCADGPPDRRASKHHPQLAALGGVALIFGVLTSMVWALIAWGLGDLTGWAAAPLLAGLAIFVVTALIASALDWGKERSAPE